MKKFLTTCLILLAATTFPSFASQDKNVADQHQEELDSLIKLDIRIENQVQRIIDLTTKYKDASGSHLIRNKEKSIRALKSSAESYKKRRDRLFRDQKSRRILEESTYKALMNYLEQKSELRIKQLVEVSSSLATYSEYYDNDDYRHNNSKAKRASKNKARLIKDMKSSIKKLEKEALTLEKQLDSKYQKKSHDLITQELRARYKKIELLEHSILDVINSRDTKVHKVDKRMVTIIDKELREKVSDLRTDVRIFDQQAARLFKKVKK